MIGTLPENGICHQKPVGVRHSSVFVVYLSGVSCLEYLRADDNSTWIHGGKPQRKYLVEFDDANTVVDAKLIQEDDTQEDDSNHENIFTFVQVYHHHKHTPQFQRRISYVLNSCITYIIWRILVQRACLYTYSKIGLGIL